MQRLGYDTLHLRICICSSPFKFQTYCGTHSMHFRYFWDVDLLAVSHCVFSRRSGGTLCMKVVLCSSTVNLKLISFSTHSAKTPVENHGHLRQRPLGCPLMPATGPPFPPPDFFEPNKNHRIKKIVVLGARNDPRAPVAHMYVLPR